MKRRSPVTREGWWFLVATGLVGAVALDAGINLFVLIFGMMICLAGAGFLLAGLALSGLHVRRVLPPVVHAGNPYLMGIALENRKRRFPSFSIEVEDLVEGQPIDKRCYFLKLPAGRSQETAYRHTPARRGRQRFSGFRVATKFPFGLVQRSRQLAAPSELIVYPALIPAPTAIVRGLPARADTGPARGRGREGELAGLRPFRPGDDARDIHWRSTARRRSLLVREHEDDETREVIVVLDNGPREAAAEAAFERAVSEAAGLCVELLGRGLRVGLALRNGEVSPDAGPRQTARLLLALALVEPSDEPPPALRRAMAVRVAPGHPPQLEPAPVAARRNAG